MNKSSVVRRFFRSFPFALPLAVLLFLGLTVASAGSAAAAAYYTLDNTGAGCTFGVWDTSSLSCTMSQDLVFDDPGSLGAYGTAIEIAGDGITLDGAGHSLVANDGDYDQSSDGFPVGVLLDGGTRDSILNLNILGFYSGVLVNSSERVLISGNNLAQNGTAIDINNSVEISASGNTIVNNDEGVTVFGSTYIGIRDNQISGNHLGVGVATSDFTGITGNVISGNGHEYRYREGYGSGIMLKGSSHSLILNNIFENNREGIGIEQYYTCADSPLCVEHENVASSNDNEIIANNFINNIVQARFDSGAGSGNFSGNFWSDWTAPDSDGDGIVDLPYEFQGGSDNRPMVHTYHPYLFIDDPQPYLPVEQPVPAQNLYHSMDRSSLPDTGFGFGLAFFGLLLGPGALLVAGRRRR